MLAVKTRAPILPMYITEGKRFRCRATVVIGKPFTPDPKQKDYGLIADDILRLHLRAEGAGMSVER